MHKQNHIIAPMHLHDFLYESLLDKQNAPILLGTNMHTFEQLMSQDIDDNRTIEFCYVYKHLQTLQLSHLQTMITYPAFVENLLKMYIEFVKYEIDINTLPEDTIIEKEIKIIYQAMDSLNLSIHQKMNTLNHFTFTDYQAVIDYASVFEKSYFQKWNISQIELSWVENPNVFLYKAQNTRQEVEGVFQYILQKQIPVQDIQLVVLNPKYYYHIHQIAKRYNIPVSGKHFTMPSLYIQKLVSAISFIQNPNMENLLSMCNHAFFNIDTTAFVNYLKQQPCYPQDCLLNFNKLQTLENPYFRIQKLQELEQEAEQVRLQILPILEMLLSDHSYKDKIVAIFDYLLLDDILNDEQEEKVYYQAKALLEDLLKEDAPIALIIYELGKLMKNYPENNVETIHVTTLDTLLPNYPISFVLGGSQNHFPTIKEYTGIIDEHYLAKLTKFPSKASRASHYYQLAEKIYHVSNDIFFSFSCSDLQGKSYELSVEIEKRFGKDAKEWPLLQVDYQHVTSHTLSENLAEDLFLNHNKQLVGSVSSLERYQNCNYAYFIERGLKVKELETLDMDHRIMGTLQHEIVEHFVAQNRLVSKEELEAFLHPIFESLLPLFPQKENYLLTLEKQTVERFTQRLQDIYYSIQGGVMQPSHFEYPIQSTIDVKPYSILLNGVIDRIDTSKDYLRIVDYKSSKKELSDGQFEEGVQLQLLTYLMIASELLQKRPYGAYYQSVKIENTDVTIYGPKDKKTKECLPLTPEILQQEYIKNNAAKGWRMETIDDDAFNQSTYFKYKDKDFNELKTILLEKYQEIVTNITCGKIAPNPTENTCGYCPYYRICRYHGETRKISKKGKVKADATME